MAGCASVLKKGKSAHTTFVRDCPKTEKLKRGMTVNGKTLSTMLMLAAALLLMLALGLSLLYPQESPARLLSGVKRVTEETRHDG